MEVVLEALRDRIRREGQNMGRGILKVDSFINHQVDPQLMLEVGRHLAERFKTAGATKVLTAEKRFSAAVHLPTSRGETSN